ncbi:sigma-70 family RNA polymerase sigma factor [Halobacillus fulvus]|nr:sigma-70 family RNA polymerase sigma factor [Halobacillus fulvus]
MNDYSHQHMDRDQAVQYTMDHFGEDLKRIIYTYIKNHHTTDDIFQEVLLTIYQRWQQFKGQSSLKTWVIRIAINRSKDYLRSPLHRIKIVKDQWLNQKKDTDPLEEIVLQQEKWEEIAAAILNLPVKYREVMILTFQQNMTQKEIAEATGTPISTIKTRMQRARILLKKEVSEEGWTFES